jgi:hypothetical protein
MNRASMKNSAWHIKHALINNASMSRGLNNGVQAAFKGFIGSSAHRLIGSSASTRGADFSIFATPDSHSGVFISRVSSPRRSVAAANRDASNPARNATARNQSLSVSIGNASVQNPRASARAGNLSDATGKASDWIRSVSNPTGNVSSPIGNASDRTGNPFACIKTAETGRACREMHKKQQNITAH